MTDDYSDEEFAPIAAAMKRLPHFEPSPDFADRVLSRVHVAQGSQLPAVAQPMPVRARPAAPVARPAPPTSSPAHYFPRSLPARLAAMALLGSVSVTMSVVALIAMFQVDLLVFVARVFGDGAIGFLAALGAEATGSVAGIAASTTAAAATGSGLVIAGSFAAGVVAATVGLRAAASTKRKAA